MPARKPVEVDDPVTALGEELASWDPDELAEYLDRCTPEDLIIVQGALGRIHEGVDDSYFPGARPRQQPPTGDWLVWMIMAGRGWGKSRTGAEWVVDQALAHQGTYAVMAPTFGDGRDICIEGTGDFGQPSGVLSVLKRRGHMPGEGYNWNRSMGELRLANGALIKVLSAEDPDKARGWNLTGAWADELGKWPYADAFDQLRFALRVGDLPQLIITTTPRATMLIRDLVARARAGENIEITRGSTIENKANLSGPALAELERRYGGTRLGRQELEGELLDDIEGALWKKENILHVDTHPKLARIMIGIDPSTWGADTGAEHTTVGVGLETGMVVVGITDQQPTKCFVLDDLSGRYSPDEWARRAVDAWRRWRTVADTQIVPETNAGGGMVTATIRLVDPSARIYSKNGRSGVHAAKGKRARAEPVAGLYEQRRCFHVGHFDTLEQQMCFPAGTMITLERGQIPIEQVVVGDRAWTRQGWKPVEWAGVSGITSDLVNVSHAIGCVLCTPDHQLWTVEDGFVAARDVDPSRHHLLSVEAPARGRTAAGPTSTAHPSHGAASGGLTPRTGTTATGRPGSFSTGSSGKRTAVRFLRTITSTITTKTRLTIARRTFDASPRKNTQHTIRVAAGAAWTLPPIPRSPAEHGTNARNESPPASPVAQSSSLEGCEPNTARTDASGSPRAALLETQLAKSSVPIVGSPSAPLERMPDSVPIVAVRLTHVEPQPVYDLTVADAHEFYADGVLVHNCEWDASMPWSPDRVDALVWAVTALEPWAQGGGRTSAPPQRKVARVKPGARATVTRIGRPRGR